jgi:hypothetical protein
MPLYVGPQPKPIHNSPFSFDMHRKSNVLSFSLSLSFNDGIHKAGNPDGESSVMLCVYGTPIRRLYVNQYDHLNNRVSKLYPPRLRKKMLASRALETMDDSSQ